MIVFDLRCTHGHVFEAWFGSSASFEEQRAGGMLLCPLCGDTAIEKAVMAPNVGAKSNQRAQSAPARPDAGAQTGASASVPTSSPPSAPVPPDAAQQALQALVQLQAKLIEQSQWVGPQFADRARAMHLGEEEPAAIHGQTSAEEARALAEEGVPVMPLLFPVVPPNARN